MAKGNLAACLNVTLGYEGGFTIDRRDPGNWTGGKVGVGVLKGTNMGIAANTYPDLDIKNLTKADVQPLYRKRYWDGVNGEALPFGVDLAVFDFGVNSGPSRGVKYLQAIVGVPQDGKAGATTITATIRADGKATIQKLCAKRLAFMQGLAVWNTFKRGWSARVANVEAKAVAMWLSHGKPLTDGARKSLQIEADRAATKAKSQGKAGATIGAGGGGSIAVSNPDWLLIAVLVGLVAVAVVVLIVKSRQNKDRAAAYAAVAAA